MSSLHALLGDDPSLAPLTPLLIARTQGNPFFLEESVRTLVETGVLVGVRGPIGSPTPPGYARCRPRCRPCWRRASTGCPGGQAPAPDRGGHWHRGALAADAGHCREPDEALHRGLAHLQAAEFLYETSLFPERAYTFKHALTHEVAYGGLLHERRRLLHGRIVAAIERLMSTGSPTRWNGWRTMPCGGRCGTRRSPTAARRATRRWPRSASREAVACFEQALVALAHLPERRATPRAGHRPPLGPASCAHPVGRLWPSLDLLREAESLAAALDDHASAGAGRGLSVTLLLRHGDL